MMADFSDIEDLRDWIIDTAGEICARLCAVNGAEPLPVVTQINALSLDIHQKMVAVSSLLDTLLIIKKKAEYEEGLSD